MFNTPTDVKYGPRSGGVRVKVPELLSYARDPPPEAVALAALKIVRSVAVAPPPIYEAPAFRFKFLDGVCKETPVVPTTDEATEGWEEVEVLENRTSAENAVAMDEEKNESPEGEDEEEPAPPPAPAPKRWRWTDQITVDGGVTDEFAKRFHDNPSVVCVLANLLSRVPNPDQNEEGEEAKPRPIVPYPKRTRVWRHQLSLRFILPGTTKSIQCLLCCAY